MSSSKKFYIDRGIGKWELAVVVTSFVVAMFALSFTLIAYTPVRTFIPGYPDAQMRQQQVENTLRIDSLEQCIARWQLYTENLQQVLSGGKPISLEKILEKSGEVQNTEKSVSMVKTDSTIRSMAEESMRDRQAATSSAPVTIEGMHLDRPMTGAISKHFDHSFSPYIDITAPEGTMVRSVLDGTIIYTGWSELDGWCIIIQHEAGILSTYLHCNKSLHKVSDQVSAGTAIGLLGKSGGDADKGPHLHFELWQNGKSLDPTKYITF